MHKRFQKHKCNNKTLEQQIDFSQQTYAQLII